VPEESEVSQLGSWYNVVSGPYPDAWTCWNVTTAKYEGTTFCIDIAGEGIFHIDEVLNAAGTPGPVSISPAEDEVAAVEFIPKIYAEVSGFTEGYAGDPGDLGWSFSFNVSIETDYIFHVWSYEFALTWDPAVFECTNVAYGDLITGAGVEYLPLMYDNIAGELYLAGAYFPYIDPPAPQTYGPGTLATINFTVNLTGVDLGIYEIASGLKTRLIGVREEGNGDKYYPIDYSTGQIIDAQVKAKLLGDVNGNGRVEWTDFGDLATAYGSRGPPQVPVPEPKYNVQADFNLNGKVEWTDFGDLAFHYGESTTAYP